MKFLVYHKGFLLGWLFYFVLAVLFMAGASTLALLQTHAQSETTAAVNPTASDGVVPKNLDVHVDGNASKQASPLEVKPATLPAAQTVTVVNSLPPKYTSPSLAAAAEYNRFDPKFDPYVERMMAFEKLTGPEQEKERPSLAVTATEMIPQLKDDFSKHPLCWRDITTLVRSYKFLNISPEDNLVPEYRQLCFAILREFYSQMPLLAEAQKNAAAMRAQGRTSEADKLDKQADDIEKYVNDMLEVGTGFAHPAEKESRKYIATAVGPFETEFVRARGSMMMINSTDFAQEWRRIQTYLKP